MCSVYPSSHNRLPLSLHFALPPCLRPYCRVESSPFLLALSHLAPVRGCPGLITLSLTAKHWHHQNWDTFLPRGLLIAKYGMSIHVIFRLKDERDMRIFMSSSFFFFSSPFLFLLSKTCTNWLQIFRPFHVVRIPPSPHLVFFGCCRLEGPHQHYSVQSCPSQES